MRIAIWNTAFLGDAVLTLPLVQAVANHYPDAKIDFFVRDSLAGLFAAHPDIATVIPVKKGMSFKEMRQLYKKNQTQNYDIWINAHPSFRSAFIASKSKAKQSVGYNDTWYGKFFHTLTTSRRFTELDEIERLLELCKPLDITPANTWPVIHLPKDAQEKADHFFSTILAENKSPIIGIHPGSTWQTKRWTHDGFAQIAYKAYDAGCTLLFFATREEKKDVNAVLEICKLHDKPFVFDLTAELSIPELAAYINKLSCYVTNDSGPMHLAWAQHTPTTAIFGPTVKSLGFFPRGETATVIENNTIPCRPCGLHGAKTCPKQHHHCMTYIDSDSVWEDIKSKIKI